MPTTDLRERVKSLMYSRHMTQTELSRLTGRAPSRISDFLSGKTDEPKFAFVVALADAFDMSVDELIGRATRDVVATSDDERALLADYRALDATSKPVVRRMVAAEAAASRSETPETTPNAPSSSAASGLQCPYVQLFESLFSGTS